MFQEAKFLHSTARSCLHKESNLGSQLYFLKTITLEQTTGHNQGTARCILWPLDLLFPLLKCQMVGGRGHLSPFPAADHKLFRFLKLLAYLSTHVSLLKHIQRKHNSFYYVSVIYSLPINPPLPEVIATQTTIIFGLAKTTKIILCDKQSNFFSHPANTQVSTQQEACRHTVQL